MLTHVEHFWKSLEGFYIIIDDNYKPLIVVLQVDVYLNEPIKIDELIKLANQQIKRWTHDRHDNSYFWKQKVGHSKDRNNKRN